MNGVWHNLFAGRAGGDWPRSNASRSWEPPAFGSSGSSRPARPVHPGFRYDQDWAERVLVLAGSAGLEIEGEPEPRTLGPGDHLILPPRCRHRVTWTSASPPTVWLAVHYPATAAHIPSARR